MGFYHRDRREVAVAAGPGQPVERGRSPQDDGDALDIEKRRLQLARIDPEEFAYFFDKYHDRIFRYAYWKVGDHDQAADLALETFSIAWDKIDRFSWQGYSFGAWLFQIARGVVGHEIRRRGVRREMPFDQDLHEAGHGRTPEAEYQEKQERELIRSCLARLPADRQEVFILHYWLGMTVREVALVMKLPAGTVSSHLRRGRVSLRRFLAAHGVEQGLSPGVLEIVQNGAREDSGLRLVEDEEAP